jgi:hypothetical protein
MGNTACQVHVLSAQGDPFALGASRSRVPGGRRKAGRGSVPRYRLPAGAFLRLLPRQIRAASDGRGPWSAGAA